jgi:hypothetical protein
MCRAYTKKEIRDHFLFAIRSSIKYWSNQNDLSTKEKLDGLASSILSIIDGCSSTNITLDLVIQTHPEDKEYSIENEENWYENGTVINSGLHLHKLLYSKERG